MKKSALIIGACLALLSTGAKGQEEAGQDIVPVTTPANDYRERINFGIKAGATSSTVYDEQGEEFRPQPKYGFTAGAYIALPIGKYLGVQPELALTQRGFYATGTLLGSKYTLTRTTTYLDVPILLDIKPSPFFSIVAGPQYSYLLKQRDVFVDDVSTTEQVQEFENDEIRKNVLGATVGADITVRHFVFAARYAFDLQRNHGDGTSDTPRYKNTWLQASVGLRF